MSGAVAMLPQMKRDTWLICFSFAWLALIATAFTYLFVTTMWQ
jgi:hypothetical protein